MELAALLVLKLVLGEMDDLMDLDPSLALAVERKFLLSWVIAVGSL